MLAVCSCGSDNVMTPEVGLGDEPVLLDVATSIEVTRSVTGIPSIRSFRVMRSVCMLVLEQSILLITESHQTRMSSRHFLLYGHRQLQFTCQV